MPNIRGARMPSKYDPAEPLKGPTPLPVYAIDGQGGFIAKGGRVYKPSLELHAHEGGSARTLIDNALAAGSRVFRVLPGEEEWREVHAAPEGSAPRG